MDLDIIPSPLTGSITAIPSKSVAHRLLICAAFADRPTVLTIPSSSGDIDATIDCLRAMGAGIVRRADDIVVTPAAEIAPAPILDCRESGSSLRFLLPTAAALCENVRFTGCGRLPERPLGDLTTAMKRHGVSFRSERLPLETSGRLHGGKFALPGDISSQYLTGLLLALPRLEEDSEIRLTTKLASSSYVDITLCILALFGIRVKRTVYGYFVPGRQTFTSQGRISVDGDWSNAAFFLAAGAIGGSVTVTGLNPLSPQGDKAIVELLRRFGAKVTSDNGRVTAFPGALHGCEIDLCGVPDLLPALALVAACAEGETRFVNGARLRYKESDRLASTATMLRSLGGEAEQNYDGLRVRGRALEGGVVQSFNDHRIAMAAAIAGSRCSGPVTILGAEAVNKSHPAFFRDYIKLGGNAQDRGEH